MSGDSSDHNTLSILHNQPPPPRQFIIPANDILHHSLFLSLQPNNHSIDFNTFRSSHNVLLEILKNHPLSYALSTTTTVPLIYLQQFWHHLKYDTSGRKAKFTSKLAESEIEFTFRTFTHIFHLSQKSSVQGKNDFDQQLSDSQICEGIRNLGYDGQLLSASAFRKKNLTPLWSTLFLIINRCLTSKTKGVDQCNISILRFFHAVIYGIHFDYAFVLWSELVNVVNDKHSNRARKFIPMPRFLAILIKTAMTCEAEYIHERPDEQVSPQYKLLYVKKMDDLANIHPMPIPLHLLHLADQSIEIVREYRLSIGYEMVSLNDPDSDPSTPRPIIKIKKGLEGEAMRENIKRGAESTCRKIDHSKSESDKGGSDNEEDDSDDGVEILRAEREKGIKEKQIPVPPKKRRESYVSIGSHLLRSDIEEATVIPAVQSVTPPSHLVTSQQVPVSFFHGEITHNLSNFHLKSSDIETQRHPPQSLRSFQQQSSLEPFNINFDLARTQTDTSQQVGLRDSTGTVIVTSFIDVSQGLTGNPASSFITQPTLTAGHTVSTVVSTDILRGSGITLPIPTSTRVRMVEYFKRKLKGKKPELEPSPPLPRIPTLVEDLSVDELKSLLYAKMLSQAPINQSDRDLIGLLRLEKEQKEMEQQRQQVTIADFDKFKEEIFQRTDKIKEEMIPGAEFDKSMGKVFKKLRSLKKTCKAQIRLLKRKHDDQDPNPHERKKKKLKTTTESLGAEQTESASHDLTEREAQKEGSREKEREEVMLIEHTQLSVEKPDIEFNVIDVEELQEEGERKDLELVE